jgi:integral membrane sensor domain MASE1
MTSLLLLVFMVALICSNIIYKGCHPFNTQTQMLTLLLIPATAIFYGLMNKEDKRKDESIQGDKKRARTK